MSGLLPSALACLLAALCALGTGNASAQDYPTKIVRLIVGNAPGGLNEVPSRWIAARLAELWGRQVVVDFRGGVAGTVASETVARATADGHTLLFVDNTVVLAAIAGTPFAVDPLKDIAPIALVDLAPTLFVVRPSLRIGSLQAFIAHAKKHPGRLSFGSTGTGGTLHLCGELLNSMTGMNALHIPYKGEGPAMNDLLAGRLDSMFIGLSGIVPHMRARRIVALGGAAMQRTRALPDLPSVHEQGVTGFDCGIRHGIVAPAGTPPAIVNRIHGGLAKVLAMPETARKFSEAGLEPAPATPEEFAGWIRTQIALWKQVIQAAGIKRL